MKNYNMLLIKKTAKVSGLSSGKIEKYEHLRDEEYYLPIKFKL